MSTKLPFAPVLRSGARLAPAVRVVRMAPRSCRPLSTTPPKKAKNRVYTPVRRLDDLHTYQLLSSSSRQPLLTLWTAHWCSTCKTVSPLIESIVEAGVGEQEGGVGFCAIEYDSPDIMADGTAATYMITSIPTLLSFDAGEAQVQTKVMDARKLADRAFLEEWIRTEARRHGDRGGGGPGGISGLLGGLFGGLR
ncbi:thioredoxin 2 [Microdochium nivale]|nr:thioredoxin 2 [Microdochium nivale]